MCDSKVGSAALLCVSGARIFDFTGALPKCLISFQLHRGQVHLTLDGEAAVVCDRNPLDEDAGRGAIEGFVTKLTAEVGFRGSVAREFMMFLSLRVGHGHCKYGMGGG